MEGIVPRSVPGLLRAPLLSGAHENNNWLIGSRKKGHVASRLYLWLQECDGRLPNGSGHSRGVSEVPSRKDLPHRRVRPQAVEHQVRQLPPHHAAVCGLHVRDWGRVLSLMVRTSSRSWRAQPDTRNKHPLRKRMFSTTSYPRSSTCILRPQRFALSLPFGKGTSAGICSLFPHLAWPQTHATCPLNFCP